MDSDLQKRIQDHYEDPYHHGRCDFATHCAEFEIECDESSSDAVAFELSVSEQTIREIWFEGRGCILSQAVASMFAEKFENKRTEEVRKLSVQDALEQIEVKVDPAKTSCCKLALDAIQAALNSQGIDIEDQPNFGGPDLGDEC